MDNKTLTANSFRIAGLWYLLMAVASAFSLLYVPSRVVVEGDAAATGANILAHPALYRLGILGAILGQVLFLALALSLRRLFHAAGPRLADLMAVLVLVSIPIAILNTLTLAAPVVLLEGSSWLKGFTPDQLNSLAMASLNVGKAGIYTVEVFWGLWLFPFGILVWKSGLIPKFLGALLILSGASYLAESLVFLLAPSHLKTIAEMLAAPMALGEVGTLLWLLIRGARIPAQGGGQ